MYETIKQHFKGTLFFPQESKTISAEDFFRMVQDQFEILKNENVIEGDKVLVSLPNTLNFCVNLFALWKMKAVVMLTSAKSKENEINELILQTGANFHIDNYGIRKIYSHQLKSLKNSDCLILFTSGSTGHPKAVPFSSDQIGEKLKIFLNFFPNEDFKESLCFLPLSFGHGLFANFLFPMFSNNNLTILDASSLDFYSTIEDIIYQNKITFFSSIPTILDSLLNLTSPFLKSSLKRIHVASAPLTTGLVSRILIHFENIPLYNLYGATELISWVSCSQKLNLTYQEGEIGIPFCGTFKIDNSSNELFFKSTFQTNRYLNNDHSEKFVGEWFRTGDIVQHSKDTLNLQGRLDDIINIAGSKVYPKEINHALESILPIKDCYTFSNTQNDKTHIYSFVVLEKNLKDSFNECEILLKLSKIISHYKVPHRIFSIHEIPKNSRGKVSKTALTNLLLKLEAQ